MESFSNNIYVFLSHPTFGIGGAQLYVRDKSIYLRKQGYKVIIISGNRNGELVISEFSDFETHLIPQLTNKPIIYSNRKRKKIVNTIVKIIGSGNNIIIESSDVNSGAWGELVAHQLGARHIIFCLAETFPSFSKSEYDFLRFKLNRKELYGIHQKTLSLLFKGDIEEDKQYAWYAICDNKPLDVPNKVLDGMHKADYNIGSIGRIGKPYIPKMLEGIALFAQNHPDKSINVLLCVGNHSKEDESELEAAFRDNQNVSLFIFGPLVPLPLSLFKICDVFVSSAGCAGISLHMDIPTITFDANDLDPIGILGLSAKSTLYRTIEPKRSLESWLEDILIHRCCDGVVFKKKKIDIEQEYYNQLSDVLENNQSPMYYSINTMQLSLRNIIQKVVMMCGEKTYKSCKSALKMQ